MFCLGKRSKDNLHKVHPTLRFIIEQAIKDSPYDFTITDAFRTAKMQNDLYQKGRTIKFDKNGKKINKVTPLDGYKRISNHQFGMAIDFYIYENGKVNVNGSLEKVKAVAKHIVAIGKKYGVNIRWGGEYGDYPHIELMINLKK